MERAVNDAARQIRDVDGVVTTMANLIRGRLRHVKNSSSLKELKRELRAFNVHTGRWRNE